MPKNYNAFLRCLALDEDLHGGSCKSLDQLCEACYNRVGYPAKARTVEKDLRVMRETFDAPIPKAKHEGGERYYHYTDPSFSIIKNPYLYKDVVVLQQLRQVISDFPQLPIFDEFNNLVYRFERILASHEQDVPKPLSFEYNLEVEGLSWLQPAYRAIVEGKQVQINYKPFDFSKPLSMYFSPLLIKEYRNRWFLFGREKKSCEIMNLALDRIQNMEMIQQFVDSDDKFDTTAYFRDIIGVSKPYDTDSSEIKIWVSHKITPYWQTKPLHESQQLLQHNAEGSIYEFILIPNFEFKGELLRYGAQVEVLEPLSLRDEMADQVQQMAKVYGTTLKD